MKTYQVGGFTFSDEETAKAAAKELKVVDYILGQMKTADADTILKVYNQVLDKKMFSTSLGLTFLQQLRENLVASGDYDENDIRPVEVGVKINEPKAKPEPKQPNVMSSKPSENKSLETKTDNEKSVRLNNNSKVKSINNKSDDQIIRLKRINKILIVICGTLLLCIVGMFYVNSTINSPNILNYEEKILDKYSTWEQELTEREEALREREGTN